MSPADNVTAPEQWVALASRIRSRRIPEPFDQISSAQLQFTRVRRRARCCVAVMLCELHAISVCEICWIRWERPCSGSRPAAEAGKNVAWFEKWSDWARRASGTSHRVAAKHTGQHKLVQSPCEVRAMPQCL